MPESCPTSSPSPACSVADTSGGEAPSVRKRPGAANLQPRKRPAAANAQASYSATSDEDEDPSHPTGQKRTIEAKLVFAGTSDEDSARARKRPGAANLPASYSATSGDEDPSSPRCHKRPAATELQPNGTHAVSTLPDRGMPSSLKADCVAAWALRILSKAGFLGDIVKRTFKIGSLCSGMCTEIFAAEGDPITCLIE